MCILRQPYGEKGNMRKLTQTEMQGHVRACKADAAKHYDCSEKDLHVRILKGGAISIRRKNAAQKERQE